MEDRNDFEELMRDIENNERSLRENAETLREIEESQQATRQITRQTIIASLIVIACHTISIIIRIVNYVSK